MINKKLSALLATVPLALALAVSMPGHSAEKGGDSKKGMNVDKGKKAGSAQTQAVELAALADQLATYGDRKKDAMALIVAAKIQSEVGVQAGKQERTAGKSPDKGDKKSGAAPQPRDTSVAGLTARAKQYAGDRKDLIALADDVAKAGARGAVGGPKGATHTVEATAVDHFRNIMFQGGQPAAVAISGDGDTDLDLYVYDENNLLICRADGATDDEICRWTPRWTGVFRIEVRNLGNVYNRYRILTN
jgi:hypothetical protein